MVGRGLPHTRDEQEIAAPLKASHCSALTCLPPPPPPPQMLWVNLIMDSLASLALATEPPDTRLLAIPPFSQGRWLGHRAALAT